MDVAEWKQHTQYLTPNKVKQVVNVDTRPMYNIYKCQFFQFRVNKKNINDGLRM